MVHEGFWRVLKVLSGDRGVTTPQLPADNDRTEGRSAKQKPTRDGVALRRRSL